MLGHYFIRKISPNGLLNLRNFHVSDAMHVSESKEIITSILFIYAEENTLTNCSTLN
jgi:hypothetical protein